jgi:hypothetical protein
MEFEYEPAAADAHRPYRLSLKCSLLAGRPAGHISFIRQDSAGVGGDDRVVSQRA